MKSNPLLNLDTKIGDAWFPRKLYNSKNWQYLCVLSGQLAGISYILSFVAIGGLPPVPSYWDADRVHEHYFKHENGCKAAAILLIMAGAFYLPWVAVISKHMRQIPNVDPILCDLQLVSGAVGFCTIFTVPGVILATLISRDYGPELTLLLSDLFWTMNNITWPAFWIQNWTLAWAVFADKSPNPIFPKVVGVVNVAAPVGGSLASGIHMQFYGPMARNGALAFWLPLGLFSVAYAADTLTLLWNIWTEPDMDAESECNLTAG
ncbi:hypothetical protein BGW36DRAFT_380564 [Talaromyces proteolyticus]|uniref:Uncharacterized protein n=1 Tax=Talaromyces proteolyticus TaxID=1131652 RepID=A0AAD4KPD9_9EURO|nr:uncharacterized protein BGW36DRAFT_380564 [Talaromyces proteolyticus]KAH8696256.1 hypothetical protein BGW36DRAFT_380564 [Talaromyces proteolyticus]